MAPNVARLTAVVLAAVAFRLEFLVNVWLSPMGRHTWPYPGWLAVGLAGHLVALAVPFLLYPLIARFGWRPITAAFWVDQRHHRFIGHALTSQTVFAIFGGWWAARLLGRTPAPIEHPPTDSIGWTAIPVVLASAVLLLNRPRLTLTSQGLTYQGLRTSARTYGWGELEYVEPLPAVKGPKVRLLRLRYPSTPQFVQIWLGALDVDPGFLDSVLREYTEHAEHRHAIGTLAELARLWTVHRAQEVAT